MNEKQFHEIIKNMYIFMLAFQLAAGLKESLLMLLNVGAEKWVMRGKATQILASFAFI